MPHIRIRALSEAAVKDLSRTMPKELAQILNTTEDNFTVEKIATTFYRNGEAVQDDQGDPFIEFVWFERGADARAATAAKITEMIRPFTNSKYIAVVFTAIPKDQYFENGKHF